jgi:4-alpha-glucanotransferase
MEHGKDRGALVRGALRALDVRNLSLCIHAASFPGDDDEDVGRGAPASRGGLRFLEFVRRLGFTGLQLGPEGMTPPGDPSPYRGSAFPKDALSIALAPLVEDADWGGLLPGAALEEAVKGRPEGAREHADHAHAARVHERALQVAYSTFAAARGARLGHVAAQLRDFERDNAPWLERYELFEALQEGYASRDVSTWSGPTARLDARVWHADQVQAAERRRALRTAHAGSIAFFRFVQFVAHAQRRRLSAVARGIGLRLFGDLPIGLSPEDEWCHPGLFLDTYRMGAPPSRTTPEGQPWGYPVLDPRRYRERDAGPGPAVRFLTARLERMFAEVDGVRVDHPHGLVCPWVYDARTNDHGRAVRMGARLFESPALPDHPELAAYAIARPDQLNPDPTTPRHADDLVVALEPQQVRRYGILLDVVIATARAHGRGPEDVACEVLSTLPAPLARVLAAYGLGRFRVTQKAVLSDPADVYRSENARAEDWVMVSTHDTRPIWAVVAEWQRAGDVPAHAEYLAWRLAPRADGREALAAALNADLGLLVHAQFADLFASPARNVMVFFADLLGLHESYNVPGTVGPQNWSLRVPPDYAARYGARWRAGQALDLPLALSMALRARGVGGGDLLRGLETIATPAGAAAVRRPV